MPAPGTVAWFYTLFPAGVISCTARKGLWTRRQEMVFPGKFYRWEREIGFLGTGRYRGEQEGRPWEYSLCGWGGGRYSTVIVQ